MKIGNFNFAGCRGVGVSVLCGHDSGEPGCRLGLRPSWHEVGAWRFLLLFVFVGLLVFVGAVTWVGSDVVYYLGEDAPYYHDLSANITGFDADITFAIDTQTDINWTNSSGSYLVDSSVVSSWLFVENSVSGNLSISANLDNESGFFIVPIQANNASGDDTITNFEFQINATNDIPVFEDLNSSYDFPQSQGGDYTIYATDEEEHYPLNFDLTFLDNCTHAAWSGRTDGENCSIFNLSGTTSTSTIFDFNPGFNDVGTYWVNFSATDFNGTCPHAYCDVSSYEENKSTGVYLLLFNVYSSLSINVSNCTGGVVMEGETFNCTINITAVGADDSLDFSSLASFRSARAYTGDSSWFYADATDSATDFFYSLPVSVTPGKSEVGNWTIDFSVDDGSTFETGQFDIFVNFTESNVSLDSILDLQLYENDSFVLDAYDNDLLIQDWDDIKHEVLTFTSNVSWVSPGVASTGSGNNYSTSIIIVDHSYVLNNFGVDNYSVMISVSDVVGNTDSQVFVVEVLNESAPVWNASLDDPVSLELIEDVAFVYNVSMNVSDPEGDNVSFYYENVSAEFCSLDATNFNSSSGMISFTPADCDVGYHDVTIIATNGKLNSSWSFNFTVLNVADDPAINAFTGDNGTVPQTDLDEGVGFLAPESVASNFSLIIDDDDFLVPAGQESYYNESLTIDLTFTNSTGSVFSLFNFSFVEFESPNPESASYFVSFIPGVGDVGDYTVFVNISDIAGTFVNRTWFLNVTENLDAPVLAFVDNASLTIYGNLDFDLSATDDEDDYAGLNLTYSIVAVDSSAPNLTVNGNNVEFNMSSNESYAGEWSYNISVIDNDSITDWQLFYLFVYGTADLVLPAENSSFSVIENVSSVLNFTVNHSVGDDLVYEFWVDSISCTFQNSSNCSYGNISFREDVVGFGNGSVLGWSFVPGFSDESYGNLKNLTVKVYPNTADLSSSQKELVAVNFSFKLNISHTNAPVIVLPFPLMGDTQANNDQEIEYDLSEYFSDVDVDDSYYSQSLVLEIVSDSVSSIDANGVRIPANVSQSNWSLVFNTGYRVAEFFEVVNVTVSDIDENNVTLTSAVSNNFKLTFTVPTVTSTPSSGGSSGSSSTKLKFYSLRIIVPEDVIISDDNYIEIPFGLENSGTIDLHGIDMASQVLYNNAFSDDVKIDLGVNYVDVLKAGERRDYTMRILADTDRSGRYKATIFANISSPKFFDWGDFFIDLRRTNESEAEELLIFTEKIISDNPECLELTEVFRRAQEAFEAGDEVMAIKIAEEVSAACEDAISANEQVRYRIEGFVERNFYYISFVTLAIFFFGFIVYVYKRVRFNKSVEDEYIN